MKSVPTNSRRRVSVDEALALWSEYKRTGDLQVRNRLVMTFAPLVKYIVFKKVREFRPAARSRTSSRAASRP